MIEAIVHYNDSTLIMDLPRNIYDIHEKLMSIGYAGGPNQAKLTDNEGDALRVKLYSRIEMGNHLIRMLSEQNTLADANTLAFAVLNASNDIKLKLGEELWSESDLLSHAGVHHRHLQCGWVSQRHERGLGRHQ